MVARADLAEVFFRPTLRPAASAARGSTGTARFSLEAAERRPAAPDRSAARRDETASARSEAGRAEDARAEDARTEDARNRAARTDRAASSRSKTPQESRAQTVPARSKPVPAGSVRDGTAAAAARTPGAATNSATQRPERPAGDGTEPAQEAAAEGEAAKETGAVMASEKDARETKESDAGAPDAAAPADPAALLAPPPSPVPAAATAAIAGGGGAGEGESVEAAGVAASGHAAPAVASAAAGDASVSAASGAAGFEAALAGMQEAAQAAPAPASPAASLPPPGGGSAHGTTEAQAASQAAAAAPQPATPPIPLGAVPMTIGLRSLSGMNRFAIRLDPVELGRIDVSLDLDKAGGKARAHLVVDRPETLALLQRDASALQQALAQAGFDVGAEAGGGGIDLSLRGETGSQGSRDGESHSRGRFEAGPGGPDEGPAPLDRLALRHLRAVSGLDIRI